MVASARIGEGGLTAEEEQRIALRIVELEREVDGWLRTIPACRRLLEAPTRVGRTRVAEVHRLAAAVRACPGATTDTELRRRVRRAWAEAHELRWRLALSADAVALREARRLRANPRLPLADLVQEARLGLFEAAKRYEPGRSVRFATYARWWARAALTRAIDLARAVHVAAGANEQLRNLRKLRAEGLRSGESPSDAELARDLGLDVDRVRLLLAVDGSSTIDAAGTPDDVAGALELADDSVPAPDVAVEERLEMERLRSVLLPSLPRRERKIVEERLGLRGRSRSIDEIAASMRLSNERVRQLWHQSVDRLRMAAPPAPRGVSGRADGRATRGRAGSRR